MLSSMAQWSIRLPWGQAVRVQSAAEPFLFFSFLFSFFFFFLGGGGRGAEVGCCCLFLDCLFFFFLFFLYFVFTFFPLLTVIWSSRGFVIHVFLIIRNDQPWLGMTKYDYSCMTWEAVIKNWPSMTRKWLGREIEDWRLELSEVYKFLCNSGSANAF